MSTERVIVQRSVAPQLFSKLRENFEGIEVGLGHKLSALASVAFAEKVEGMLGEAEKEGARFLVGNGRSDNAVVQPHIVIGVKPEMKIWQRESFGPGALDSFLCMDEFTNEVSFI